MLDFLDGLARMLTAAAAVLALLLALMAWRRRERPGMAWFALLMLSLGILSVLDFIEGPSMVAATASVALLWALWLPGPALWVYVRRMLGVAPTARDRPWLHLLPATVFAPLCALMAWRLSRALSGGGTVVLPAGWEVWNLAATMGAVCSAVFYLGLCLFWLRRHRRALLDVVADPERHELRWLEHILTIGGAMLAIWLVGMFFDAPWTNALSSLAQPLCTLYIGVRAMRQPFTLGYAWLVEQHRGDDGGGARTSPALDPLAAAERAAAAAAAASMPTAGDDSRPAYARSGLTEARAQSLLSDLDALMRTEKPYLEEDLTLPALAGQLGISPQLLSQLLNQKVDRSFHDYIADYRIRDAMRCLRDPAFDGQTVLEIAQGAGFRSKSAFHDAFRRVAGTTPSHYRRHRGAPDA